MFDITQSGLAIAGVSVGLTLVASLVRSAVLDKEKLKGHKEKIKHHQEKMKEAQKNKDVKGMQKHQKEMMATSMEQMKHTMKPTIFTIIPFLLVFSWMRGTYGVIGLLYNVSVTDALPQGAEFVGLDSSGESVKGDYVRDINSVVWMFPELKAGGKGELEVELLDENPGSVDTSTQIQIEYTLSNGSKESFRMEDGSSDHESLIELEKTQPQMVGNKVTYTILYENIGSNMVVTLLGFNLSWFGWYFVCAILSSIIFNKLLGIS